MGWLEGFSKRLKLIIDYTKIDDTLVNFPLMLKLSDSSGINNVNLSSVFTNLTSYADRKRIAVTLSDGTTQRPVEIETWDSTNSEAYLWTKSSGISTSEGTVLYLYYDVTYSGSGGTGNTDYIGDLGDAIAETVWDENFVGVWHMAQGPSAGNILDSTSNAVNLISQGTMTSGDSITYGIGKAIDFDGIDDYLYTTGISNMNTPAATWEVVTNGYSIVDDISHYKLGMVESLPLGAPGEFDEDYYFGNFVLKDTTNYKMWYNGYDGSAYRIGLATSASGTNWTKQGMVMDLGTVQQPVMDIGTGGEFDDVHVYMSKIIKDGTSYKIWYTGYDGSNNTVGYATSGNGTSWTKQGQVMDLGTTQQPALDLGTGGSWDDTQVSNPHVIKEDSTYKMWYTGYDNTNWRIGYATSASGTSWIKQGMVLDLGTTQQPVLEVGTGGSWDDTAIVSPSIIKDGSTYKMWYNGHDGSNYRIGYATSLDGINWTKYGVVLDLGTGGEFDDAVIIFPYVIKDGSTYKMWYAGNDGTNYRTGYATSTNGTTWTKQGMVIDIGSGGEFDDVHVSGMSVLKDGLTYKIWYTGQSSGVDKIGYATSTDGINWTKYGLVLDLGSGGDFDDTHVHTPYVIKEGSTYKMWYMGYGGAPIKHRLGYATSPDGIVWTKQGMVLDVGASAQFDDTHVGYVSMVMEDSVYKMWYSGHEGTNWLGIGYVASSDGILWTRDGWDDNRVQHSHVIKEDSTYKMWYTGHDGTNYALGYATSLDGSSWTKQCIVLGVSSVVAFDDTRVTYPFVINDSGTYKMWYAGHNGSNHTIGYATSSNGVSWTKQGQVLDIGSGGEWDDVHVNKPYVIKENSTYKMWYTGYDGTNSTTGYATSSDGTNWVKQGQVLDIGEPGQFDSDYSAYVSVMKEGTTYKMWYSGYDSPNYKIGYVTSPDGIMWTREGWDSDNIYVGNVLKEDSVYKMWYTGRDVLNPLWNIGYATSTDGFTWTKHFRVLEPSDSGFDSIDVLSAHVMNDAGTYKMWYAAWGGVNYKLGYAVSPDGLIWTKQGMVLDKGSGGEFDDEHVSTPYVIKEDSTYKMWYNGHDGSKWTIGYATSIDGTNWIKQGQGLGIGAGGQFDSAYSFHPSIIKEDDLYKMWYTGRDVGATYRIGYVQSPDGINWTREGEFDTAHVAYPSIIKEDAIYKMWYSTVASSNWQSICYATSTDAVSWVKHCKVLGLGLGGSWDDNLIRIPSVMKDGSIYKMWYIGHDGTNYRLGYATSPNGLIWTKQGMVLDLGSGGEFDDVHIYSANVIKTGSIYRMWYTGYGSVAAGYTIGYATSTDGVSWTKQGLVIDWGRSDEWDDAGVHVPTVVKEGSTYRMWYTGADGLGEYRIGYAEAPLNEPNLCYNRQGMVLDLGSGGEWDDNNVTAPSVIKDGSTYKMWYTAHNSSVWAGVGYATSTDGISWTKYAGNPVVDLGGVGEWDEYHVYIPSVIKDGSIYKMWYSGNDAAWSIGYATSSDGIIWVKQGIVLDIGTGGEWDDTNVIASFVMKDGSTYKMWYGGEDSSNNWTIGYATSSDGVNWIKQGMVLDAGETGEFDYDDTGYCCVIKEDSIYKMWFGGKAVDASWRIGYATSLDGIYWVKQGMVLDTGVVGGWDDNGVLNPNVIRDGSTYKMWCGGHDGSTWRIMYTELLPNGGPMIGYGDSSSSDVYNLMWKGGYATNTENEQIVFNNKKTTDVHAAYCTVNEIDAGQHYMVVSGDDTYKLYLDGESKTVTISGTNNGDMEGDGDTFVVAGRLNGGSTDRHSPDTISEIRVSNIERPAAWIKATYNSNWDSLITFTEQDRPTHYYNGYITQDTAPVVRAVRLYRRDTGALVDSTTSNDLGYYYLTTVISGEHFIVAFDDTAGVVYNAQILDKLMPLGIE